MATSKRRERHDGAVILAPTGKDAALATSVLGSVGIGSVVRQTMAELVEDVAQGAGVVIIAHEALARSHSELKLFQDALTHQAPWSDIPVVFLCAPGENYHRSLRIVDMVQPGGNFTLLERPVQKRTLISVVQMALRARRRQYQVRDLLQELKASQEKLNDKVHDLEQFEQSVVNRELKMIELEKENQQLREALKRHERGESVPAPRR